VWFVAEPAMFILGVMIIFTQIKKNSLAVPYAEFLAISYPTIILWRNTANRLMNTIEVNRALLHHRPIYPLDLYYARILLEFSSGITAFLVIYIICLPLDITHIPDNLLKFLLGYFCIIWFSFGFVLMMAGLSEISDGVEKTSHIILYLMLPFSGIFFPAYIIPEPVREYYIMFPLVGAMEYMHAGYYGYQMQTYYNIYYMIIGNLIFTVFGYIFSLIAVKEIRVPS
jgi:capsular polysaccharide transport system permease protein